MPTIAQLIADDELAKLPTSSLIVLIVDMDAFGAFVQSATDYDLWACDAEVRGKAAIEAVAAELDRRIPARSKP